MELKTERRNKGNSESLGVESGRYAESECEWTMDVDEMPGEYDI